MDVGSKVQLKPTDRVSGELRSKVAGMGDKAVGEIIAKTSIGICTVQLPVGVVIEGHSHPLEEGGSHYIDLHQSHLQELQVA